MRPSGRGPLSVKRKAACCSRCPPSVRFATNRFSARQVLLASGRGVHLRGFPGRGTTRTLNTRARFESDAYCSKILGLGRLVRYSPRPSLTRSLSLSLILHTWQSSSRSDTCLPLSFHLCQERGDAQLLGLPLFYFSFRYILPHTKMPRDMFDG